jgi:hypothetical protein
MDARDEDFSKPHVYRQWVDEQDVGNTCCLEPLDALIHIPQEPEEPTCPARIVTRVYAENGDDTYTDEITVCGGELVVWRQQGGYGNACGEGDTFTTQWDVRCLEDQHVVLTPYDDTNGPTVPCPGTDAEVAHWIWKAVGK